MIATASLAEAVGLVEPDDLDGRRIPVHSRWVAYGTTKKQNILTTVEAASRWLRLGVVPTCFHPGVVRSRFGGTSLAFSLGKLVPLGFTSPRAAADTLVHLATDPDGVELPGGYFYRRQLQRASPDAYDADLARRLWEATAAAVGV